MQNYKQYLCHMAIFIHNFMKILDSSPQGRGALYKRRQTVAPFLRKDKPQVSERVEGFALIQQAAETGGAAEKPLSCLPIRHTFQQRALFAHEMQQRAGLAQARQYGGCECSGKFVSRRVRQYVCRLPSVQFVKNMTVAFSLQGYPERAIFAIIAG